MVQINKYPKFTLTGTIIDIDEITDIGHIESEDGIKRFFVLSEMPDNPRPGVGRKITFTHAYHKNGPKAENPTMIQPILVGTITSIDFQTGVGHLLGEDNISRFFLLSEVEEHEKNFTIGCEVHFQHVSDKIGAKAESVKLINKDRLIGIVNFYNSEKCFGFVCGYNGKSYYFHILDFANTDSTIEIGTILVFNPKISQKGLQAKNCDVLPASEAAPYKENMLYSLPEAFKTSKTDSISGYCIIEKGEYIVYANSQTSFEEAEKLLTERAKQMGANALINVKFYKENDSQGNYIYKTFSCEGQIVFIAKPNMNGNLLLQNYCSINKNIKEYITNKNEASKKWKLIFFSISLLSIALLINKEIVIGSAMLSLCFIYFFWPKKAWLRNISQ